MKTDLEKYKNVVKWLDGPESKGFEEGRARLRERYRLNKSKLTATEWNAVMLEIEKVRKVFRLRSTIYPKI